MVLLKDVSEVSTHSCQFVSHPIGAGQTLKFRRQIYMAAFLSILAFSIFMAIPAAVHSTFIQDDTGRCQQNFPSLSSRTRNSESLDLRLVSDSDSVLLYMVRQVSVSDSDSNFSSLLVSSLESDHFGGLLY